MILKIIGALLLIFIIGLIIARGFFGWDDEE